MSELNASTHPRKVYMALKACASTELRAASSLDFLCNVAGSHAGSLFLLLNGKPTLVCSTSNARPAAGLLAEVELVAVRELDLQPDARTTKTLDLSELASSSARQNTGWPGPNGERFELRMLSTYRDERWVPIGLVALAAKDGESLAAFRQAHIDALCNAFIDANAEAQTLVD
jgi:hypothetical protein